MKDSLTRQGMWNIRGLHRKVLAESEETERVLSSERTHKQVLTVKKAAPAAPAPPPIEPAAPAAAAAMKGREGGLHKWTGVHKGCTWGGTQAYTYLARVCRAIHQTKCTGVEEGYAWGNQDTKAAHTRCRLQHRSPMTRACHMVLRRYVVKGICTGAHEGRQNDAHRRS